MADSLAWFSVRSSFSSLYVFFSQLNTMYTHTHTHTDTHTHAHIHTNLHTDPTPHTHTHTHTGTHMPTHIPNLLRSSPGSLHWATLCAMAPFFPVCSETTTSTVHRNNMWVHTNLNWMNSGIQQSSTHMLTAFAGPLPSSWSVTAGDGWLGHSPTLHYCGGGSRESHSHPGSQKRKCRGCGGSELL